MSRQRRIAVAVAAVALLAAAAPPPSLPPVDGPLELLLGPEFPIRVNVSRPAALLHWMDSLAALRGPGVTAGKTVPVHREAFGRAHGRPTDEDNERLGRYVALRQALASRDDGRRSMTLTECFVTARGVGDAVTHCSRMLDREQRADLAAAVEHFDARFEPVWRDGIVVREFLARVAADPNRDELAEFLVSLAAFYGVPAVAEPPPRLLLAPVGFGAGTHAQALGRFLLVEVRPGEGLTLEIPPIVHESAHFLDARVPDSRRLELRRVASRHGAAGRDAWRLLHEALPTALAQGVAAERFQGERWSLEQPWYHRDEIDAYAKRIFPIVRRALAGGAALDAALVERLVLAHPAVRPGGATRRSP